MRKALLLSLAWACAVTPGAVADTAVWAQTHPATWAPQVSGTRQGTVVAVVSNSPVATSAGVGGPVSLASSVAVSRDYGVTWAGASSPPRGGSSFTDVAVGTADRWYAFNGNRASITRDGGRTWSDSGAAALVRETATQRDEHTYAGVDDVGAAQGTGTALYAWGTLRFGADGCVVPSGRTPLTVTHDGGARWRRVDLPYEGRVTSVDWLNARRGVLVLGEIEWHEPKRFEGGCESPGYVSSTGVWTTTDGGRRWRRVFHVDGYGVDAAWTSPESLAVALLRREGVRTYVSRDGGRTYRRSGVVYVPGEPFAPELPVIDFADSTHGWLIGPGAGIFRTDNGGSEWTYEPSPADNDAPGWPDLVALTRDRAVAATGLGILARAGTVPAAPLPAPRAVGTGHVLRETVLGPVRRTVGPGVVTVTVRR